MEIAVLFFEIRGRRCALPVVSVREVLAVPAVTPVPTAHAVVRGLAPVHGQVLPLIDLGVWLGPGGEPPEVRTGGDAVLIEDFLQRPTSPDDGEPVKAALLVDRVLHLGTIDEAQARAPAGEAHLRRLPAFVEATISDQDGPALLLDAAATLAHVRAALAAHTGSGP